MHVHVSMHVGAESMATSSAIHIPAKMIHASMWMWKPQSFFFK